MVKPAMSKQELIDLYQTDILERECQIQEHYDNIENLEDIISELKHKIKELEHAEE